jgi:glutamate-1-semialdehyde 2,1-aminomutase
MTTISKNDQLFERAQKTTPGGVNSPVRAFRSVGGTPRFITRAEGPYFWDADGKRYIDYIGSWGPAIVGHAHPDVVKAVQDAATRGLSFGAPTEGEIEMAEEIVAGAVAGAGAPGLVGHRSHHERAAPGARRTGRDKIVKFEGCYHGHADSLLVKRAAACSPSAIRRRPACRRTSSSTRLVLDYNNVAQIEEAFASSAAKSPA